MRFAQKNWAILLVTVALFTLVLAPTAWAQEVTATLRIEYREATKMPPTELTVQHQDWSEFGITAPDPGFITPIHLLAAGLDYQYGEGSAADMISAPWGFLSTIDGSNGSLTNEANTFWMWAANQSMPVSQTTGWGYAPGEYPVQNGDAIDFLGSWGGQWGIASPYLSFFDYSSFDTGVGQPITVRLLGLDAFDDFDAPPTAGLAGAEILIDSLTDLTADGQLGAITPSDIFTNAGGYAEITFTQPGVYLISAQRIAESATGTNDITRPFAVVTVAADTQQPQPPIGTPVPWDSFRGNAFNSAITTANTPTTEQNTRLAWTHQVGAGAASPVKVGGYIYIAGGSTLWKLNAAGQVQNSAQLAGPTGIATFLAANADTVFVPLDGGRVQAFDALTLEQTWITSADYFESYWEVLGALTYRDGYLYGAAGFDMFTIQSDGYFFCLDAETGQKVWSHSSDSTAAERGFYWAGAAVTDTVALFAGDDAVLVSHLAGIAGAAANGIVDTAELPGGARSPVLYVEADNSGIAFVTTRNGYVARVEVAADGSLGSVTSAPLSGAMSTSTPVEYRNRLYVVSGERFASGVLDVFDATTLERLRSITLPGFSQSSPLLSTAAATAANDYEVHLYMTLNDITDDVIRVSFSERDGATLTGEVIYRPGGQQSLNSLSVDGAGRLFFVDGQGRFTALATADGATPGGPGNGGNGGNGNDNSGNGTGEGTEGDGTRAAGTGPKTGDDSDAMRWLFIAAAALALIITTLAIYYFMKKSEKEVNQLDADGAKSSESTDDAKDVAKDDVGNK